MEGEEGFGAGVGFGAATVGAPSGSGRGIGISEGSGMGTSGDDTSTYKYSKCSNQKESLDLLQYLCTYEAAIAGARIPLELELVSVQQMETG